MSTAGVKAVPFPGQPQTKTPSWHNRPLHPVTGVPCDYFFYADDGRIIPRWRKGHWKKHRDLDEWWFSVAEVAQQLGVIPRTVRAWCLAGKIEGAVRIGEPPRGEFRIQRKALKAFMRRFPVVGTPVTEEPRGE